MSLLPTCTVCDTLLRGYNGGTRCPRCSEPCHVCGGDVAYCKHPLRAELEPKELPNGRFQVAA